MSVEKNWWENTQRGGKRSSRGERRMLITRAPFDEELAHVPEEATRSDFLLKRLDELLDDDDLLEQVRADASSALSVDHPTGTPLDAGGSDPAVVCPQAVLQLGL
jgi:hypothetical protein